MRSWPLEGVGLLLAGLGELVDWKPTADLEDTSCGSGSLSGAERDKEGAALGSDWVQSRGIWG